MKINKPVTVCNNCGVESLDAKEFATVTLTIDGHVEYLIDLCRERCLPPLVELGRRDLSELHAIEPVEAQAEVHQTGTVCIHCGRSFKSANGLKVHVARMHA
jgi:hypothetical protein